MNAVRTDDRRRVLVVANPFPPQASAGTTRVVRFLRHLPNEGWAPTVLAARTRGPAPVPPDVRVLRAATPVPARLQGAGPRVNQVNRWLFVPDNFAPWVIPAVRAGERLLKAEPFDAIFSSSPRASVHVIASTISALTKVPWLADYRDPWATYQFAAYPTALHRAAQFRLEAAALRRAVAVTAVNEAIVDDLLARHPWLAGRTHVLPNGYDAAERPEQVDLGDGLWLVHTGRVYGREAQVDAVLAALAQLPDDVRLLFVGGEDARLRPLIARHGIGARVRLEGLVPLARSLGYQRAADGLLLLNGTRPESMSSKVFEYLDAGRPIFAVSPHGSAARALLAETGGGTCVALGEPIGPALVAYVAALRRGDAPVAERPALERYRVDRLTARLAELLKGMVEPAAAEASA